MGLRLAAVIGLCASCVLAVTPAYADARSAALNRNTISLMASEPEWLGISQQLAKQLDHEDGLRVLPLVGRGSVQALSDLINLQAVDAALISSDALVYAQAQGLLLPSGNKIAYLADVAKLPVVLVARREISNVTGLAGQRISTGPAQSAAFATGELLLGSLGVPFTRVAASGPAALVALTEGRADAALLLGTENLRNLDAKLFHVLQLPLPKELQANYAPALLSEDVLGELNLGQGDVETVSIAMVLAVFNWPADNEHTIRLKHFAKVLLSTPLQISQSAGTNLTTEVQGWQRHLSAEQAINELNLTPNSL